MTRFARAKGSKASNERVPESATPWNVMKFDLQKSQEETKNRKHREKFIVERQKNYDEFVKETESKTERKWAEFPKPNLRTIRKKKNLAKITEKDVTDDMIQEMCHPDPEVDVKLENMTKKIEQVLGKERANKKKITLNKSTDSADNDEAPEEASTKISPKKLEIKKAKNKKQALKIAPIKTEEEAMEIETTEKKQTPNKNKNRHRGKKNKGENKFGEKFDENKFNKGPNQQQKLPKVRDNLEHKRRKPFTQDTSTKISPKKLEIKKAKNKKQALKIAAIKTEEEAMETEATEKKQTPKVRDNLEHKRRKPFTQDTSIKIKGKDQAIVLYQGFPVLKSDHDRLVELRKSFISKGIPRSEVQKTMKLERRRAEKTLSRAKKIVCYQCRESGHMLSECPQLGDKTSLVDNAGTGLCFKCGSGEHTYKECKVSKDFSFAKCFICKEQGHISSQCPDNPKGLYPKGGACKLCGDVTHLKKDCPKHVQEQKSNLVFLNTISDGNIESIEDDVKPPKKETPGRKKIVF